MAAGWGLAGACRHSVGFGDSYNCTLRRKEGGVAAGWGLAAGFWFGLRASVAPLGSRVVHLLRHDSTSSGSRARAVEGTRSGDLEIETVSIISHDTLCQSRPSHDTRFGFAYAQLIEIDREIHNDFMVSPGVIADLLHRVPVPPTKAREPPGQGQLSWRQPDERARQLVLLSRDGIAARRSQPGCALMEDK